MTKYVPHDYDRCISEKDRLYIDKITTNASKKMLKNIKDIKKYFIEENCLDKKYQISGYHEAKILLK
jgi:hypothetical protein